MNSPAFRAGLRPADQIIAVDDTNTERATVSQVSGMLKGPKGTPVTITVRRAGHAEPMHFSLVRDNVPRGSVNYAFWLRPGIAYMRVEAFNETTSHEVDQALARFPESAIDGLILDLRDNPGGLVQEAVNVADRFLHKGQLIVSHHGRASAETKFIAKRGERGREYPIVVLVNRGTASAAEILTGALQDHDRAWVFGESTFGKGLVQAPFPLSGNSALLLTIAKYYTPSGRLIQRDYEHQGLFEYLSRENGKINPKDMKKTDSGRIVYGGDGITPDEKYDDAEVDAARSPAQRRIGVLLLRSAVLCRPYRAHDQGVDAGRCGAGRLPRLRGEAGRCVHPRRVRPRPGLDSRSPARRAVHHRLQQGRFGPPGVPERSRSSERPGIASRFQDHARPRA